MLVPQTPSIESSASGTTSAEDFHAKILLTAEQPWLCFVITCQGLCFAHGFLQLSFLFFQ